MIHRWSWVGFLSPPAVISPALPDLHGRHWQVWRGAFRASLLGGGVVTQSSEVSAQRISRMFAARPPLGPVGTRFKGNAGAGENAEGFCLLRLPGGVAS